MQPLCAPPRDHLTPAQVAALLQDAPALGMSGGLELVDRTLTVIEDISGDLAGGNVERSSYATMHGSCRLKVSRPLDWGAGLVRPYVTLTDGTISARFNLGVYHTTTPSTSFKENPPTFDVEGYDVLYRLNQPVGGGYSIAAGEPYLEKVEDILTGRGYLKYLIDPAAASTVAPASKVWPLTGDAESGGGFRWLGIVNDMLGSAGYQGIWSDWDGYLRCEPYHRPVERSPEWYYSDDPLVTMLSAERSLEFDYFDTPNRWVVWRSNMLDEAHPVEGNGLYVYVNQSTGPTSVAARDGLVITRAEALDAANHGALIALAEQMIDADMQVPQSFTLKTSPNPLHWHFDRMLLSDSASIPYADVMCTRWSLPLPPDTGDMDQSWAVLVR